MSIIEQPFFDEDGFKEFPTLVLPNDPEVTQLLQEKLEQYDRRLEGIAERVNHSHPKLREQIIGAKTVETTISGYQKTVLSSLLETGIVDTKSLHEKLVGEQGENFHENNFVKGGAVIAKYLVDKPFLQEMVEKYR